MGTAVPDATIAGAPSLAMRTVVQRAFDEARQDLDVERARAALPSRVRIVEVAPRDGIQNEARQVPTEVKVSLVQDLVSAGLQCVEMTGFVSPRRVPQLSDASQVTRAVVRKPGVKYPVLVPNLKGFELAVGAGAKEVAVCASATESFSLTNINCSIAESLSRFRAVADEAKRRGMLIRGYVSCVAGCPYEGDVPPEDVAFVARALYDIGCFEVSLGDTTGVGTPAVITAVVEAVVEAGVPVEALAIHCHDTHGAALANVLAALLAGVSAVDSSIAGLGGCPFAPGAAGNVATEDCVFMLDEVFHIDCGGADLSRLIQVGNNICAVLGRPSHSRVAAEHAGTSAPLKWR
jgi:hydroxymethylglutaryl-CoA lyase